MRLEGLWTKHQGFERSDRGDLYMKNSATSQRPLLRRTRDWNQFGRILLQRLSVLYLWDCQ